MFNTKYSKEEKIFLKDNLKKLRKYLEKKSPKNDKEENKYIDNFLNYKISRKDSNKINKLKLLRETHLKKFMYFKITELGESNKEFYKSKNLYEYTKKNWLFQKQAFEEDSIRQLDWMIKRDYPDISKESDEYLKIKKSEIEKIEKNNQERFGDDYEFFYSYGTWCRWIENNSLQYGVIESVENYFIEKVDDIITKKTDIYIPSCLTNYPDKEWTSNDDNTSTWNIETRANGREDELIGLRKKLYQLEVDFVKENLKELLKELKGKTFKNTVTDYDNDIFIHLYIPDIETAKMISSDSFLVDFYKLEQPFEIVKQKVKNIIKTKKLKKQIYDIYMSNFKEYSKKCSLKDSKISLM